MTVAELIKELETMPQDAVVWSLSTDEHGGWSMTTDVEVCEEEPPLGTMLGDPSVYVGGVC